MTQYFFLLFPIITLTHQNTVSNIDERGPLDITALFYLLIKLSYKFIVYKINQNVRSYFHQSDLIVCEVVFSIMMAILIFLNFLVFLLEVGHAQKTEWSDLGFIILSQNLFVEKVIFVGFDDVAKHKLDDQYEQNSEDNVSD